MKFLNKYARKYGLLFATGIFFLTLEAIADLMQPTIMSRIVDVGVKGKNGDYVLKQGIVMLSVAAFGAVCACIRSIIASNVSQCIGMALRFDLFKKIQDLSFGSKDAFEEASLITRLTNNVTQVQNFINGLMRIFVKAPLLCIGSIIMAAMLSLKMSAVLIVIVPVIILLIGINLKVSHPFFVSIQKGLDRINTVSREYLTGVRVVKAFNRFDYETERFEKENINLGLINRQAARTMAVFSPLVQLTVNIGIVVILWMSGFAVQNGSIKAGAVIAFINYMTQILFSLSMISYVFMSFVRAEASAERIAEVFEERDEKTVYGLSETGNQAFITAAEEGTVIFEKVSFAYSCRLQDAVLKNISFKCHTGETIGIIGSTGSGKSTLVNLIPGFYYAGAGTVKINGVDIKTVNPQLLREKIAVVPQKTILFSGSIEENLRWGKEDATEEEIQAAAEAAKAHHFILSFQEGYKTVLGQGGVNLSGGQKQRLSIARALIKRPQILILDDCTSAVDLITEAEIRAGLKHTIKNLTTFIIAQRITSVKAADKIIVLDNGEIADMGSHDELIKRCGIYRDIYSSQMGKEEMTLGE